MRGSGSGRGQRYEVAALAKGLLVLSTLADAGKPMRLQELAAATRLPAPTVFRLLRTLQAHEYVRQLPDDGTVLGAAVMKLALALRQTDVAVAGRGPLRALAETTGETVNMGVLLGSGVLYTIRILNADFLTANIRVGSVLPAWWTSMGKMLLASLPDQEWRSRLADVDFQLAGSGPNAVRTIEDLARQLEKVRQQDWASQDEEVSRGLLSIAAPVRDESGQVIAAINLAVQTHRLRMRQLVSRLLPQLLATADEISRSLGYSRPRTEAAIAQKGVAE